MHLKLITKQRKTVPLDAGVRNKKLQILGCEHLATDDEFRANLLVDLLSECMGMWDRESPNGSSNFLLPNILAAKYFWLGLPMPGNEVGDRIHNFLGQESFSQGQHQSQVIDGTWPGLSNSFWVGGQRQVESDRVHSGQSSSLPRGMNFTNQARQKETNLLGVDRAPRGLSVLDSPIGNGHDFHQKNPLRQQSGMTDMQLLQKHAIMQELMRQQLLKPEFHLPETRQFSSTNQVSAVARQLSDGVCPVPINGVPVHDALNYTWKPEHMTPNANWLQHGASPAMQGSSGGLMFSPDQGHKHLMGLVPQQVDQSFYGISTGSARGNPYQYSSVQMDKTLMQQVPTGSNSFPVISMHVFRSSWLARWNFVSRQAVAVQGLNSLFHSENLQKMAMQPKNEAMQESLQIKEHCGPPETSLEKSASQVSSSQNVATLDPLKKRFCLVQMTCGMSLEKAPTWSAVAETSSNDIRAEEEWSGLGLQNCEPPSGSNPASIVNDGSEMQSPWTDDNLHNALTLSSKPLPISINANNNLDFLVFLGRAKQMVYQSPLQKHAAESAQLLGNIAQSPDQVSANSISSPQGIAAYDPCGQTHNKPNSWNLIQSASRGGGAISKSQDNESLLQLSQNNDHRGSILGSPEVNRKGFDQDNVASITDSTTKRTTKEKYQQNLDKSPQTLVFALTYPSILPPVALDNVWLDANDPLRGKQKSSIQVSHKPCITRNTQCFRRIGSSRPRIFVQSKYTCHAAGKSTGTDKGIQVDKVLSKSSNPDSAPERPFGGFVPNKIAPVSLSNKPSASLGFGLKTWSSISRFTIPDCVMQGVNSLNSVHDSSEWIDGSSERAQTIQLGMNQQHHIPTTSPDDDFSSSETSFPSSRSGNQNHARDPGPGSSVGGYASFPPSATAESSQQGPPPDSGLDCQQLSSHGAEQLSSGSNSMMRDALVGHLLVPSGDSKMLSSLSKTGDNHETRLSSNSPLPFVRKDSQHFSNSNNSAADVSGEHSRISPQMAPSWFDREQVNAAADTSLGKAQLSSIMPTIDNEPEIVEDWWPSVLRSKRRLVLTTAYAANTSSVLGDACSTAYIPESITAVPPGSGSIRSEKFQEERNQSIIKAAEEFIFRAKMLEIFLQSLDKASILDLRLECQDLEKVSVINRFVMFHGRGQADGETLILKCNCESSQILPKIRYRITDP
ncbi:hypothetical protein F3Y22_tig00112523pilonHSYRG00035 [Hibiscus syriacus]|uniref:Uncharacterized protein n=1 Tax=Hibiscus syriacus TaxID=106335 RepID=A0A6A2X9F3_HIBSY|nr:hypothetical protein F3Y22_tig00112523pilonHSYRG00035 [Hibiscus syriacus]